MDGPHPPLGFDSGLDGLYCDPSLLNCPDMTAFPFDDESLQWDVYSPHESVSSGGAKPQSQHVSAGGSSRSPTGSSLIFTPTSTQPDFQDVDGFLDTYMDGASTSPASTNNISVEDYVHIESFDAPLNGGNQRMSGRPSRNFRASHGSFMPSESPRLSDAPLANGQRWEESFTLASSNGMDNDPHQRPFLSDLEAVPDQQGNNIAFSNAGMFEAPLAATTYQSEGLPYRPGHTSDVFRTSFENMAMLSQQMAYIPVGGHNLAGYTDDNGLALYHGVENRSSAPISRHHTATLPARDAAYMQYLQSISANAASPRNGSYTPAAIQQQRPSNNRASDHAPSPSYQRAAQAAQAAVQVRAATSSHTRRLEVDNLELQALQSLSRRPASHLQHAHRSTLSAAQDHAGGVRKGGRPKNRPLNEQSREKSSAMRKVGACWRCAMQRDPCDHGDPCSRCSSMRSQRGQAYFFDCDRSKLPAFVHEFLPPSMTIMHEKQTIEDSVASSVLAWDRDNGIDIYLSSGYGPPLLWKVYEFRPKSTEYLSQLQYRQDNNSDRMVRTTNYSPPYGLLKIDTSHDTLFDRYLDRLLEPQFLGDFGWTFYEAESVADDFQAGVLALMCKLYLDTSDAALKSLLNDILRMLLITYIMGHTLTIIEDTVPTVIGNIRHSPTPRNLNQRYTSPRLANRQLKFFFAVLRTTIYEKLLKWQQQTLHTAGKKDETWLRAFCVTLGFAMVLEEVQHTLYIQADASVARGDMTREAADQQASNACGRIDERFKLLVGLFQCKYRDKKWGDRGSFGPGTPEMRDPASRIFLRDLRETISESRGHLSSRENVAFAQENQCYFTSRLTAKFLIPFFNLPGWGQR